MSIRRFWFYNKQVDRLEAEQNLRTIYLLGSVTSQEGFEKQVESLHTQMGEIFVYAPTTTTYVVDENNDELDPEFDRAGLEALRARIKKPIINQD